MSRLVAIGMGSNLGESLTIFREACRAMNNLPQTRLQAVSRVRLTHPITGMFRKQDLHEEDDRSFLNAVALLETSLLPEELLEKLMAIETRFGRERTHRWAPRTLDLDILLDMSGPHCSDELLIPHPRLGSRLFFLACLEELLPDWEHPWCGLTVQEMVTILSTSAPFFVVDLSTFGLAPPAEEQSASDTQQRPSAALDTMIMKTFVLVETKSQQKITCFRSEVLSKGIDPGKPITDWNEFGDAPCHLSEGRCVLQARSVDWVKKQKDQPEETDLPPPRLIIVGPKMKRLLWNPDLPKSKDGVHESSGELPDLSLLRACAIPVVFVEDHDIFPWADQIIAAVEASQELGRVLGELI